jgi:hypothetical protein
MRDLAIAAVLAFVAWCAGVALADHHPHPAAPELAAPVYAVGEPIAVTVADSSPPVGEAPVPTVTTPQPLNGPATVAAHPDRGVAIQVTPTEPPPVTYTIPHYDAWVALARCESGGDWSINTGNGYYGGLQFSLTSWKGAGGLQYAPYPHMAGTAQQMLTAERLLDMQGWAAWPSCSRQVGLR